jgi:hypothetical protein
MEHQYQISKMSSNISDCRIKNLEVFFFILFLFQIMNSNCKNIELIINLSIENVSCYKLSLYINYYTSFLT